MKNTKIKKVKKQVKEKTKPKGGKTSGKKEDVGRAETLAGLAEQFDKMSTKNLKVLKNSLPGLFEDDTEASENQGKQQAEKDIAEKIKQLTFEEKTRLLCILHERVEQEKQPEQAETKEKNYFYFVEKWRKGMSYKEKLAIVLSWQLMNKEHIYKREQLYDGSIGNDISRECEEAVVRAMSDPEYLKTADRAEVALTAFVAGLLPMEV